MRSHPRLNARMRGLRPVVDRLETRELLSAAMVPHGDVTEMRARGMKHVSVIKQIARAKGAGVSTIPANGDVNPYGVAFVPTGFLAGGTLAAGDVLVSNFNNSKNLQGTGTTIMRVTPGGQSSVFYQGPPGVGLSTALGVLKAGYVVVGEVPSSNGTSATAGRGALLVLDNKGQLVQTIADPKLLDGPWDLAVNESGSRAQIFVANVLSGTVTRIDVTLPSGGGFQVASMTQIASGYTHRGDPAAFELGPTGLAFNAATGVLYVASTADNAIYSVPNAATSTTDQGTGSVVYRDRKHLHGPLGLAFAGDGNLIAAQGDAVNAKKRLPSELVEFTPSGKFVGQVSLSRKAGGAFGVASSADGTRFAAVNDIKNTVKIVTIAP